MLNKQLNELLKSIDPSVKSQFEVIQDPEAAQVKGGTFCQNLESCGDYYGDCSTLMHCTSFECSIYAW